MPFLKPHDTVYGTYSTKRWLKDYFENRKSVNFSGMIQEMGIEYIKTHTPEYYEQHFKLEKHLTELQSEIKELETKIKEKNRLLQK